MERINFIGAFNKIDLILNISKILVESGKKVLIVDATINERAKYIIPTIETNSPRYITNYQNIDIAIGFENYEGIREYLGIPPTATLDYDYLFLDIDDIDLIEGFQANRADKNFFVTSLDLYSLKKGMEVLKEIGSTVGVSKIYFSNTMSKKEDEYVNYLSMGYKISWNDEIIYFPYQSSDKDILMENQRTLKIKFKGLTSDYKKALLYIASQLNNDQNAVKKAFKQIERGM